MVLTAEVPAPMYAHLPRTRREYENIHGVNRHDAWIEKYQSDTYLEEYYARKDDTLAFAGELYPEYVLVILTRRYTFVSAHFFMRKSFDSPINSSPRMERSLGFPSPILRMRARL